VHIIYSYFLYPIILIIIDRCTTKKEFSSIRDFPSVSIIVSAYNEEKVIRARIENCLGLDYPKNKLEIIIASDGSSDGTVDIVNEYVPRGIVLLDYMERKGKVNVLNEAIPLARNEIIVFSDANTLFTRDAIDNLVMDFGDSRVGCVCGALIFVTDQGNKTGEMEGIYWKYEQLLKSIEGKRGSLLGANGAIYAIRKELFERCPDDTVVEDLYIPMKILEKGYYVTYNSKACAFEKTVQKVVQEKKRRVRIGAGDFQALSRLTSMLNPKRGFSAFAFWSHKVLRWFVPFSMIVAFISNLFLLETQFYFLIFLFQAAFYLAAFYGQVLSWAGINIKMFSLCYYFISMNLALLLGFIKYKTGKQKVAWERTQR